ncbi:MAG: acyl-CoA reductase [Crocinitomicaceae bacterium]
MNTREKSNILSRLGVILQHLAEETPWPGYEMGINQSEYEKLNEWVEQVHIYNGWFKSAEVRKAFKGIAGWLSAEKLENWVQPYVKTDKTPQKVAIIMAGNIPLVGFHDFISVFLSGHKAVVKMASDDRHLFPALLNTMALFDQSVLDEVELVEERMKNFDAVIATGSDNSARYFESYFGKYPHIIRKNRNSVALITGEEDATELNLLGKDIFDFYGLGCRNVSQIWIPESFDLNRFFEAIYDYNSIIHHNKYANNYDYNKAVYLMNKEQLLDNGFLLLKEDQSLHSPLAMLHYQRYKDEKEFEEFTRKNADQIQLIVGRNHLPFGKAQQPGLEDYADGINTLEFLSKL